MISFLDLPISFSEAALGCKKDVPSIYNHSCRITIPEGTQNAKVFRVKGEGFPNVHSLIKGTCWCASLLKRQRN